MEMYPQRLGIYRTQHEKYTTYWGDGSGRDSYAVVGNAGLRKPEAYVNTPPRTGYQPKEGTPSKMFAGPVKPFFGKGKEATVLKYYGDGSGRDSYVTKECGGLIPSYESTSPDKIFYSSLRHVNTEARRTIELDSSGQKVKDWGQPQFRETVHRLLKNQFQYQRKESERLSKPKVLRRRVMMSPQCEELGTLQDYLTSEILEMPATTTKAKDRNHGSFFDKVVEQRRSVKTKQEMRRDTNIAQRFKQQRATSQLQRPTAAPARRGHSTIDQAPLEDLWSNPTECQRPGTTLERRRVSQKGSFMAGRKNSQHLHNQTIQL